MTAKQWLNRGYKLDMEINALRREQQEALLKATAAVVGMGGDKVQSAKGNSVEKRFINYAAYSERINKRIDELYAVKQEIIEAIGKVDDAVLRALLTERYLNFQTWENISSHMNYSFRQVIRLHSKALMKIKDVIECHI